MTGLTCPNGHAMDDGYFECPCCGAYRPSAHDPRAIIRNGRVVGMRPTSVKMIDRTYGHLAVESEDHLRDLLTVRSNTNIEETG